MKIEIRIISNPPEVGDPGNRHLIVGRGVHFFSDDNWADEARAAGIPDQGGIRYMTQATVDPLGGWVAQGDTDFWKGHPGGRVEKIIFHYGLFRELKGRRVRLEFKLL